MDISELAQEFDIHPDVLVTALDGTARLLRATQENVRPADKKSLRGIAKTLSQTNGRLCSGLANCGLVLAPVDRVPAVFGVGSQCNRAHERAASYLQS